jgi:hypothetical protein
MTKAEHCNVAGCSQDVVSLFEGEGRCREHFISYCYAQLEKYEKIRKGHAHSLNMEEEETIRRFVHECSRQANEMEHATEKLDNLERARLLLVIEEANDLGRHLRRSPRNTASIAVRLRCDTTGGTWEEDTKTVTLSRYGASVQCIHPAKPGEGLQLIRSDTGQKVQALVVWKRSFGTMNSRIGIEFMDCDNFWGLDWALETAIR